jgi:hypothetical protein
MFWEKRESSERQLLSIAEDVAAAFIDAPGEIKLSENADEYMKEWYFLHRLREGTSDLERGYYHRKHIQLLRIALVVAFLDNSHVIKTEHIQAAESLLGYIERNLSGFFSRLLGNKVSLLATKIYQFYKDRNATAIYRRDIFQDFGHDYDLKALKEAIEFMEESDMLRTSSSTKNAYKVV